MISQKCNMTFKDFVHARSGHSVIIAELFLFEKMENFAFHINRCRLQILQDYVVQQ